MTHRQLLDKLELRDINFQDVINWEYNIGESFLDYHGGEINIMVFGGFLLAKEPELASSILKIINDKLSEIQNFSYDVLEQKYISNNVIFEYGHKNEANYMLMKYVLEFINLTNSTKHRLLYILTNNICNPINWDSIPSEDD